MQIKTASGWAMLGGPMAATPVAEPWWDYPKAKEYNEQFLLPDGRDLRDLPYSEWHKAIQG